VLPSACITVVLLIDPDMLSLVALPSSGFTMLAPVQRSIAPTTLQPAACVPKARLFSLIMAEPSVEQIHKDADAVFSVIDVDGNGSISADELTDHLVDCGYKSEAVKKIFSTLDTDGDGALSRDELRAGMVSYTPLRKAPGLGNYNEEYKEEIQTDADALFDSIDMDRDGEVTEPELRVHLRQFSKYTDAAITNIFDLLDVDEDGGITKEELRAAFIKYSALRQAIGAGPNYK